MKYFAKWMTFFITAISTLFLISRPSFGQTPLPQPTLTEQQSIDLRPTGRRNTFALTQFVYARPNIPPTLPQPQKVFLVNFSTRKKYELFPRSIMTVGLPYNPETSGPGLVYISPQLPFGMYEWVGSISDNETPERFYIPDETLLYTTAQEVHYTALPGFVRRPTFDINGHTFGTDTLTFFSNNVGGIELKAQDGRTISIPHMRENEEASGVTPVIEDVASAQANVKYAGRSVWPMGNFQGICVRQNGTMLDLPFDKKVTIAKIYRAAGWKELPINPPSTLRNNFIATDPFIVAFSAPVHRPYGFMKGFALRSNGTINTGTPTVEDSACVSYYVFAADPWQLDRMFSFEPKFDPKWPLRFRKAIEKRNVLPGMSRKMVVVAIGYPSDYGTIKQLDSLDHWNYDAPTPFQSEVIFRNGEVRHYDPPRNLP